MSFNRTVFVDVDTQLDFMLPNGNLYVPGAETIIPNLERLMGFARTKGVPVISSVDAHPVHDEEFQHFPPHCVKGTPGQEKIPQTLLPGRRILPNEHMSLPEPLDFSAVKQWILEKQKFDLFTNVNALPLLEKIAASQCIVFGVATEYCVRAAVLGLLRSGLPVTLLVDAIRPIGSKSGQDALLEMQEAGANLLTTQEFLAALKAA